MKTTDIASHYCCFTHPRGDIVVFGEPKTLLVTCGLGEYLGTGCKAHLYLITRNGKEISASENHQLTIRGG